MIDEPLPPQPHAIIRRADQLLSFLPGQLLRVVHPDSRECDALIEVKPNHMYKLVAALDDFTRTNQSGKLKEIRPDVWVIPLSDAEAKALLLCREMTGTVPLPPQLNEDSPT